MSKPYRGKSGHLMLIGLPVDLCIFTMAAGPRPSLEILLVRRRDDPYAGQWAFPGGFTQLDRETLSEAARRELFEETHVDLTTVPRARLQQLGAYYSPQRDPRGYTASVAFIALMPEAMLAQARAGDDAAEVQRFSVFHDPRAVTLRASKGEMVTTSDLAFDHQDILADALSYVRQQFLTTTVAEMFLPKAFTLSELQAVLTAAVPGIRLARPDDHTWATLLTKVIDEGDEPLRRVSESLYTFSSHHEPALSIYPLA